MCDSGNTMTVTVTTAVVWAQHQATNNTASLGLMPHLYNWGSDGGLEKDKQVKKATLFKNHFYQE